MLNPKTLSFVFYVLIISFLLISCEPKVFEPDINSVRDLDLVGTWRSIHKPPTDSCGLFVVTEDGYADYTYWVNNAQMKGFFNLGGLWHNIDLPDENGVGEIYHAGISSCWQARRWKSNFYYKLLGTKDSLLQGSSYNSFTDTLVWNEYQLIYDNTEYIGIK